MCSNDSHSITSMLPSVSARDRRSDDHCKSNELVAPTCLDTVDDQAIAELLKANVRHLSQIVAAFASKVDRGMTPWAGHPQALSFGVT
jgi:hypothetical protein